jgi:signal peptidase II
MLKLISRSGLIYLPLALLTLIVDRLSKLWVIQHLNIYEPFNILPFFNLTLAHNTGAAFSFLHSASGWQNSLFSILAFVITIFILIWLFKTPRSHYVLNLALSLILGGALANAWDRLQYAYVIDFLDFYLQSWHFAIFNLADSAICLGAFLLMLSWYNKR